MADTKWHLKGRNFSHCNCAYGCPCQFNALPTHGNCKAVVAIAIDQGHHGDTKLDGLKFGGVFSWPGPIHEGHGEAVPIVDERANPAQREAILPIMRARTPSRARHSSRSTARCLKKFTIRSSPGSTSTSMWARARRVLSCPASWKRAANRSSIRCQ